MQVLSRNYGLDQVKHRSGSLVIRSLQSPGDLRRELASGGGRGPDGGDSQRCGDERTLDHGAGLEFDVAFVQPALTARETAANCRS